MASEKLRERFKEIESLAYAAGLRPYDIHYFEVPSSVIYEVASYGLPTRYSHWSFGRVYQHQKTQGEMGFSKIYELILNNDPSYAFLDSSNTETINLMICAHCAGHADFFANNIMFQDAGEDNMIQVAKRHAETIDQYRKDYGDDEVDEWLDVALALERHIDVHKKLKRQRYPGRHIKYQERTPDEWEDLLRDSEKKPLVKKVIEGCFLPPSPEKDLLWFFHEYANLEDWQKRIFHIVRRESYYFYPQYRTKIINEGWACISGDSLIATEKGLISAQKYVSSDFDDVKVFNSDKLTNRTCIYKTERKSGKRIMTNRGLLVKCADDHKVQCVSGDFIKAKDLTVGQQLKIAKSTNYWPQDVKTIECSYVPHKNSTKMAKTISNPIEFDCQLASFVAFWLGEGCQSKKRGIYVRNSNRLILEHYGDYIKSKFNLNYSIVEASDLPVRYNLEVYSRALVELLGDITGCVDCTSRYKKVPDIVFESPKDVICSFVGAFYDAEGCVYSNNEVVCIVFASASLGLINGMAALLHQLGINCSFGVCKKDGHKNTYQLRIGKKLYIKRFHELIPLQDINKKDKLDKIISSFSRILDECEFDCTAKIISIESYEDEFYDFTVPDGHSYVANGLVHHNSYWHADLMHQYFLGNDNEYNAKGIDNALTSEEHLDFLSSHEKVVQPGFKTKLKVEVPEVDPATGRPTGRNIKQWHPKLNSRIFQQATRINPYYIGFRMFRDIKDRWDEYYEQGYRENEWGDKIPVTINGHQKIFEVREEEDDVSFFRNYLTEELCEKLHLFSYGSTDKYKDDYGIQEDIAKREHSGQSEFEEDQDIENKTVSVRTKEVKDVIKGIARSRNNFGVPCIVVRRVDSDGLLRLEHLPEDLTNIDILYAQQTLKYIWRVWGRPVEMIRKTKDRTWIMKYDGIAFSVDHENPDYPESVENSDSSSSW